MSEKRVRWTISLRQKDKQLFEHFEVLGTGDRSAESRRLMYLGLSLIDMIKEEEVSLKEIFSLDPSKFIIVIKPK
ncbi:hypothetical protein LOZ80_31590 [Paenibacillus sp. HWE-109]|uniref:hypothetical protein n=1 Tax=Paenibacillus sp. HWE-109 TaxID=1306526 RepID=UPI001EDD7A41|nr:hypothetical protein [Paenibacillus sp. HWE-109]UKS26048.1 hypothetical protein LOZ80_31590 [Paenibacillus sp. HWE-109]